LKDIQNDFLKFSQLPENTPEQIAKKEKAYHDLTNGKKWWRLKNLADLQVAQFFIPKTMANKDKLTTHSQYMTYLKQGAQIFDRGASMSLSHEKHFFHWFLEFPEVFQNGGFECILGNPPYLGGSKISGSYGHALLNYLKNNYLGIGGQADFVTYFLRRDYSIIKSKGFVSLISTNTISQGDTRIGGLDYIISSKGVINFALPSMKWPGVAVLQVSLFAFNKDRKTQPKYLNNKLVEYISSQFSDYEILFPSGLKANEGLSFKGSDLLGTGFILDKVEGSSLKLKDPKNIEVIKDYLIGRDLNNNWDQSPSRMVIDFQDFEKSKAEKYIDCFEIIEKRVKPERLAQKDKISKEKYWIYLRRRPELYTKIKNLKHVTVIAQTSKTVAPCVVPNNCVFSTSLVIFSTDSFSLFGLIQSSLHNVWAWKFASTMKSDLRYTPSDVFDTFPFPENMTDEKIFVRYHDFRSRLMSFTRLGLTDIYNQFHNKSLDSSIEIFIYTEFEKKYGKESWNFYNHLEIKKDGKISFSEAVSLIFELRKLHNNLDEAILEAYGWHQDNIKWGKAISLRHGFYEVDYLPENDCIRYTIHPEARMEVLKRLLQLNHERYAEEVAAGLHNKKNDKKENKKKLSKDAGVNQKELFS